MHNLSSLNRSASHGAASTVPAVVGTAVQKLYTTDTVLYSLHYTSGDGKPTDTILPFSVCLIAEESVNIPSSARISPAGSVGLLPESYR